MAAPLLNAKRSRRVKDNLTDDGAYAYTYDAPVLDTPRGFATLEFLTARVKNLRRVKDANRLVKVTASNDTDVVIQTAEFDGLGRRIKKVVTNSGDLDGTVIYLYDGWQIIETWNGSQQMEQQFIWGTQYIDDP